jgi:regulator of sirC expression with transglutaminase-like and TPR domain
MSASATLRFAEIIARPDASIPLDEAALLIAAHARDDLVVAHELGRLDRLAAGCGEPTLDGVRRHLFDDFGLRGDRRDYYDPRNSFLDAVLTRRRGIPITLSVIVIEVGRRLGVPLHGVGMPGHFLVRDKVDPRVLVDPFHGGALLDAEGCARLFRSLHGPAARFDHSFLDPVPRAVIVGRMLANLRSIYLDRGDRTALGWVTRLRAALPDAGATEWREHATVAEALGRVQEAAEAWHRAAAFGGPRADTDAQAARRAEARLN